MRRPVFRLLALAMVFVVALAAFPTAATAAISRPGIFRLAGADRVDTAVAISDQGFNTSDNVVIASGNNFPDALAGVSLAYALDAPILLVRNSLSYDTKAEIKRLGAKNAYLLGGDDVVPANVVDELADLGVSSTRVAGKDRYLTALAIAELLEENTGSASELFIAYAYNYPDALSVSNVAALKGCPILYIAADGNLTKETAEFISGSDADKVTILGGDDVISADAETNIAAITDAEVNRIYGDDRYETCLEITKAYSELFTSDIVSIATGKNYPDALAGGAFAAKKGGPLILVGDKLSDNQVDYFQSFKPNLCFVLGGDDVVTESVVRELEEATTISTPPLPPYLPSDSDLDPMF